MISGADWYIEGGPLVIRCMDGLRIREGLPPNWKRFFKPSFLFNAHTSSVGESHIPCTRPLIYSNHSSNRSSARTASAWVQRLRKIRSLPCTSYRVPCHRHAGPHAPAHTQRQRKHQCQLLTQLGPLFTHCSRTDLSVSTFVL